MAHERTATPQRLRPAHVAPSQRSDGWRTVGPVHMGGLAAEPRAYPERVLAHLDATLLEE